MEALRSSRRPAKRSSSTSTSTSTSTSYADIFGGPPSYKYTTAPFIASSDDYAEIFGGGGSSSSIPFLDLPPVSDSSDGCFIDYSEIFGARNGGVDFAVDYEDLFNSTRNSSSSSSNGRTSMEAKFSQQNEEVPDLPQEGANKNYKANSVNNTLSSSSNHADDCSKQFNMSYHRANHGSMEDATRGKTHTTQLHAIPGYSCVVDSFSSIQDVKSDNFLDIQMKDPIQTANTVHLNHFTNFKSNEVDLNSNQKESSTKFRAPENFPPNLKHHSRSSSNYSSSSGEMSNPDTTFVSVSDINLRTKPCKVPPPSRAPPKLFSKQENSKTRLYEEETFLKPKLDHQIHYRVGDAKSHGLQGIAKDTSSAAAAMKEAMEQAQARLKSAKELMERKQDKLQNGRKQGHKEATKYGENNGVKAFEEEILFNDGMTEEHLIKDDALDDMNAYKSSQMPYKPGEVSGEWKMDTDFYELINNDTKFKGSKEAFKQDGVEKNTKATVFNEDNRAYSEQAELTYEFSRAEKLDVDKEALERDDDNSKAGTTFREDLSEMPNTNKKNINILEEVHSAHQQSRTEKIQADFEAHNPISVEEAPVCIKGENDEESSKNAFKINEIYHIDEEACQFDDGEENLNCPSVTSMPYEIEKKPEIFLEKEMPNEIQNEVKVTSTEYEMDAKEEVVAAKRELKENECKLERTDLASKHEERKILNGAQGVCLEVEDESKSKVALDGNVFKENFIELEPPLSSTEKAAISANENLDYNKVETSEAKSELQQNEKKQNAGETFTEQESTMMLRDLQGDNIENENGKLKQGDSVENSIPVEQKTEKIGK